MKNVRNPFSITSLVAGLLLAFGVFGTVWAKEVPAPDMIVLSPEECNQVASAVAEKSVGGQKYTGDFSEDAQIVTKYILKHNPNLAKEEAVVVYFTLLQMCFDAQGQTDIPRTF